MAEASMSDDTESLESTGPITSNNADDALRSFYPDDVPADEDTRAEPKPEAETEPIALSGM